MLAHAEEPADRQDQRVDLMVLDREIGDLADRFILLILNVQALEFRTEHFVLRHCRKLRIGRRGANGLGVFGEYRACQQGEGSSDKYDFLHNEILQQNCWFTNARPK
jgi:hypothetical protein